MDNKLRVAVIGAGWFAAQNHIPLLAKRGDVILDGVCRLGAAELERVKQHFGFAFGSQHYEEVLARKPDIVVVASPHHLHFEHASTALRGGAHVLCEKPMTLDPAQAWALVRIAREADRHLLVANGFNYLPQVDTLRERLMGGVIGDIEHVMASFISASRNVFHGAEGQEAWRTAFFRPDRSTWQDPAQGGGFAYGQLSHSIALMLFLSGLEPVSATGFVMNKDEVDLADAGAVAFSSGAVASISGAAAMPVGARPLMRLFFAGSKGVVSAEFDRDLCEITTMGGRTERLSLADGDWQYDCVGPIAALVELAQGKGRNLSSGAIGAATTSVIASMLMSSRSDHQSVSVMGGETLA